MKVMINWDREGLGSVIFAPVVVPFEFSSLSNKIHTILFICKTIKMKSMKVMINWDKEGWVA